MTRFQDIDSALARTRSYLVSRQRQDGTWSGTVKSDPRTTAFYLNTVRNSGRPPDSTTQKMEVFLKQEQLDCGAWEKWPGSGPDLDVTLVCTLSLANCDTNEGALAREKAEAWLLDQEPPMMDSFWLGYLALNGHLTWSDAPHLSIRIVANPSWVRPNIFDFSFLRLAVVATSLLQELELRKQATLAVNKTSNSNSSAESQFQIWIKKWTAGYARGRFRPLSLLSRIWRAFDFTFPSKLKRKKAINWLLEHQENDGSFFSSAHMTSIAVVALHRMDASLYETQIVSGLRALRKWHVVEGGDVFQQFTDSTTWDTILFLDLLAKIGGSETTESIERSRNYLLECQNFHQGDWSARVSSPTGGAWCFQRIGRWYPDCDDTAFAALSLLSTKEEQSSKAALEGTKWLLSMQCSNGGWASWDRNDRAWMMIPNGGPWFARDLPAVDITSRVILLLSRVIDEQIEGAEHLVPKIKIALKRGVNWLESQYDEGRWFGSWFTHYLYGTCHALEALREVGRPVNVEYFRLSEKWVRSIVNSDGGFGEAPNSGHKYGFVAAASTPFHTACGLLSLSYCGAEKTEVSRKAAEWLLSNQNPDGTWTNNDFFAAGVPGLWYANFSNTPTYFAAKSLRVHQEELARNK